MLDDKPLSDKCKDSIREGAIKPVCLDKKLKGRLVACRAKELREKEKKTYSESMKQAWKEVNAGCIKAGAPHAAKASIQDRIKAGKAAKKEDAECPLCELTVPIEIARKMCVQKNPAACEETFKKFVAGKITVEQMFSEFENHVKGDAGAEKTVREARKYYEEAAAKA
jgi:hypothetical protein